MGNQKRVRLGFEFGFVQQATGIGSSKHTPSVCSLMLGAVQEKKSKKNYLCVCVWKGCDHTSRPKQLVSSSQGQRDKDYGQVFQAENTYQLNPASPPCPTRPSQPSTLSLSPLSFSHWPWASMWSQSPVSSSGFTRASMSIVQAR